MISVLIWAVVIQLLGWAVFPIAFRFFRFLPDRGYSLSKVLGLLLWGYGFWLLASLQILSSSTASILLVFFGLAAFSLFGLLRNNKDEFFSWLKTQRKYILSVEIVFLAAFGLWALLRSLNPAIEGTEKPMEMAFINAILRSEHFPPADPWLAGYSISYYYFGYVLVAMIIRLTGVSAGVGFNLAVALWFGLITISSYGLLYNLRVVKNGWLSEAKERIKALAAPLMILLVSNLEGLLEMLHQGGVFRGTSAEGAGRSAFWGWLNIKELTGFPSEPLNWVPVRPGGIWWWRASRVIHDSNLAGSWEEVIHEFPLFSFHLADLHPHVLGIPFAILLIAIAFNLWLRLKDGWEGFSRPTVKEWLTKPASSIKDTRLAARLGEAWFLIPVIAFGGMAFLNTWDLPIYVALFVMIWQYADYSQNGWSISLIWNFIGLSIFYGIMAVLAYLPFYLGFSSQAGGVVPSMAFMTRGVYFWINFAPLLVPIFLFLFTSSKDNGKKALSAGIQTALLVGGILFVLSFSLGWLAANLSPWGIALSGSNETGVLAGLGQTMKQGGDLFAAKQGFQSVGQLLTGSLFRRIQAPGTWMTLLVLIAFSWATLRKKTDVPNEDAPRQDQTTKTFVAIMILVAGVLVLVPEFFYLRDQFGTRMNTIFKFYYQAWIIWGVAAAYAWLELGDRLRGWSRHFSLVLVNLLLIASLIYPYWVIRGYFTQNQLNNLTLDGTIHLQRYQPAVWEAIEWLKAAPDGNIVEAVGGSYSSYARFATHTGLPNVIGWPGHESQWRGPGYSKFAGRPEDVKTIYQSRDWQRVKELLTKYDIRYVIVSDQEKATYAISSPIFDDHLTVVFRNEQVVIYSVPGE